MDFNVLFCREETEAHRGGVNCQRSEQNHGRGRDAYSKQHCSGVGVSGVKCSFLWVCSGACRTCRPWKYSTEWFVNLSISAGHSSWEISRLLAPIYVKSAVVLLAFLDLEAAGPGWSGLSFSGAQRTCGDGWVGSTQSRKHRNSFKCMCLGYFSPSLTCIFKNSF